MTRSEWSGTADLMLPDHGISVLQHPVTWDPRELAFEFRFADNSAHLADLMAVDGWDDIRVEVRHTRLDHAPWAMTATAVQTVRSNSLSEWDGWGFDASVGWKRLRVRVAGAQCIRFHLEGQTAGPAHVIWLKNLPHSLELPTRVQRPGSKEIQIGSGRQGQPIMVYSDDGLELALQMPPAEFEHLRYAAALTVLAKDRSLAMEIRFLSLMMCVEMLDGRRHLSEGSTAALLGIDTQFAALVNGMRNHLAHAHSGGGHRHAYEALKREQFKGSVPKLQACWAHIFDDATGGLHFDRLFFQLCERIDAVWCRRLQVPDPGSNRFCVGSRASLGALPDAYLPEDGPDASSEGRGADAYVAKLEAALKSKKDKIAKLNQTNAAQGRLIDRLKKEVAALSHAVTQTAEPPLTPAATACAATPALVPAAPIC